ncbi:hypothetical protein [Novosphingobium sp.]|uniref:hypothetical protein n=1 Tax=Novosphingobium sp. TaxID=1874826 RepID=UPI00286D167B|nr:hypothetical protein [Novosphingobium sp.]
MRRTKSGPGLSPRQLKHFAGAAVVLTGLLAVLVSGEDWGARAQVEAVNAKNDLVAKEAEKLGTKRITSSMVVRTPSNLGFGDDAGPGSMGQGSGGGAGPAPVARPAGPVLVGPSSQQGDVPPHGPTTAASGYRIIALPDTKGAPRGTRQGNADTKQRQAIEAASRQRSGKSG